MEIKISAIKRSKFSYADGSLNKYITEENKHLVPNTVLESLSFEISDGCAAFANAFRRVFKEELLCYSLKCTKIVTDDEFLKIEDLIVKNVGALTLNQDHPLIIAAADADSKGRKLKFKLSAQNRTPIIIDVMSDNFEAIYEGKTIDNVLYAPVAIANLRPGKMLEIEAVVVAGRGYEDAGQFTLLNNVEYMPLDVSPYNQFTKTGEKAAESFARHFRLGFTTAGNIRVETVLKRAHERLNEQLDLIKIKLKEHLDAGAPTQFVGNDIVVETLPTIPPNTVYTFANNYITETFMLAQVCYLMDKSLPFIAGDIYRFEAKRAIIHISAPNPSKTLLDAADICQKNIDLVIKALKGASPL